MGWGWLCYAITGRFVATFSTASRFLSTFRPEKEAAAKFSFCNSPILSGIITFIIYGLQRPQG